MAGAAAVREEGAALVGSAVEATGAEVKAGEVGWEGGAEGTAATAVWAAKVEKGAAKGALAAAVAARAA